MHKYGNEHKVGKEAGNSIDDSSRNSARMLQYDEKFPRTSNRDERKLTLQYEVRNMPKNEVANSSW